MNRALTVRRFLALAAVALLGLAPHARAAETDPPPDAAVDKGTRFEPGGLLVSREGGRYVITFVYDNFIGAYPLAADGAQLKKSPVQFERGQLDSGWTYLSPSEFQKARQAARAKGGPRAWSAGGSVGAETTFEVLDRVALRGREAFIQVGNTLYVTNSRAHTVVAVNGATGRPDPERLAGGVFSDPNLRGPAAFIRVGNTLYISGSESDTLIGLDLSTGRRDRGKFRNGVFRSPGLLEGPSAFIEKDNTLYVCGQKSNTVVAIDMDSGMLDARKLKNGVFKDESVLQAPVAMIFDKNTLIVAGSESNTVVAIRMEDGELDAARLAGGVYRDEKRMLGPEALVMIGQTLYVAGARSSSVIAIDWNTGLYDTAKFGRGIFRDESVLREPYRFFRMGDDFYVSGNQPAPVKLDPEAGSIRPASGPWPLLAQPGLSRMSRGEAAGLVRTIPADVETVIRLDRLRLRCSRSAVDTVKRLVAEAENRELAGAADLGGLEQQPPPMTIVVVGEAAELPAQSEDLFIVDLSESRPASLEEMVSEAISSWTGRKMQALRGATRVKDGSLLIFY